MVLPLKLQMKMQTGYKDLLRLSVEIQQYWMIKQIAIGLTEKEQRLLNQLQEAFRRTGEEQNTFLDKTGRIKWFRPTSHE